MRAFITSIGEPTTDLCVWQLKRMGFDITIIRDNRSLGEKLEDIYSQADDDFLRVDADVIVNRSVKAVEKMNKNLWWVQYKTFDMYKLDLTNGGVQYISKKILPALRANISRFKHDDRPESRMYRLEEFDERWRFKNAENVVGVHGFGQKDWQRVKKTKDNRKYSNEYDFVLVERMQDFYK
jgi:hypothetical protein